MKRLRGLLQEKLKSKLIANIICPFVYVGILIIYGLATISKGKKIDMDEKTALENIECIYKRTVYENTSTNLVTEINKFDLSIIVPVYNIEMFIAEALESIVRQVTTYKVELIIINDGSTDNTLREVMKFKELDNVKIISQENQGAAAARNRGIEEAQGRYIMFVDGDDILADNAVQKLLEMAYKKDAPIVIGSYCLFKGDKILKTFRQEEEIICDSKRIIQQKGFPCMKVYKKELFEDVRYPTGYWFEDTIICYLVYTKCKFIVTIPDIVYYYRKNENSSSRKAVNYTKCLDTFFIVEDIYNIIMQKAGKITISQYEFSISPQLSSILYSRIKWQEENIQKSIFVLSCRLVQEMKEHIEGYQKSEDWLIRRLEKAFIEKNYKMWKLTSILCYITR